MLAVRMEDTTVVVGSSCERLCAAAATVLVLTSQGAIMAVDCKATRNKVHHVRQVHKARAGVHKIA